MRLDQFSDGETRIEILESVSDRDVYIIQPLSMPTNHHIMELLLIADAVKRAGACQITAVIPYFAYARQNNSAKVIADLLTTVGIDQVITIDLHTDPQHIFFEKFIHNLNTTELFLKHLTEKMSAKKHFDSVVISPDNGGIARARAFSQKLNNSEPVIIDKHRPHPNIIEITNISGSVKDRDCIVIDDMIDTGNTLCSAARALKTEGAKSVIAYITHPVLSKNAIENITDAPIDELVVTDTIPLSAKATECSKIHVLSVTPLIANYIFARASFAPILP